MNPLSTLAEPGAVDRDERIERIRSAAHRIRRNALDMGEVQGQGYIGQALGIADVLAVAEVDVGRPAERGQAQAKLARPAHEIRPSRCAFCTASARLRTASLR